MIDFDVFGSDDADNSPQAEMGLGLEFDGGPNDPYWQTDRGRALMAEMEAVRKGQAAAAAARSEAERIEADRRREAEQAIWQSQQAAREVEARRLADERQEAERRQADERAKSRADREQRRQEARSAMETQNTDFHALSFGLDFSIKGPDGTEIGCSTWAINDWELSKEVRGAIDSLEAEVAAKLTSWLAHFRKIGFPASGAVRSHMMRGLEKVNSAATFYLVYAGEDAVLAPSSLGLIPDDVQIPLEALPGAVLTIYTDVQPVNATLLYEAVGQAQVDLGAWAGEPAPEFLPEEGESRTDWLGRIFVPRHPLARAIERWKRSGGNPRLYGFCGSASERATGNKAIEAVIDGIAFRGYVALLVGEKQCGKSTLLGEIAAVIDSQCQSPRSVLGAPVEARGVCAIVSGEDGDDFVNARELVYEPIHGEALGYVFAGQGMPWAETLDLLYNIPKVDLIAIDPFRVMLDGDEDNSGVVSRKFNELNALAQAKNCAIIVSHHLSKNPPRTFSKMLNAVRGSGVFTDRPRVVLAMIARSADVAELAVIKHNIPPGYPVWGS